MSEDMTASRPGICRPPGKCSPVKPIVASPREPPSRVFGLGFIPLVSERYDLAIRRQHLDMPSIQALLDTLNRSNYRRELESLGGYDTRAAGQRLL